MSMMVEAVQQTIAIVKYTDIFLLYQWSKLRFTQGGAQDSWSCSYELILDESQC